MRHNHQSSNKKVGQFSVFCKKTFWRFPVLSLMIGILILYFGWYNLVRAVKLYRISTLDAQCVQQERSKGEVSTKLLRTIVKEYSRVIGAEAHEISLNTNESFDRCYLSGPLTYGTDIPKTEVIVYYELAKNTMTIDQAAVKLSKYLKSKQLDLVLTRDELTNDGHKKTYTCQGVIANDNLYSGMLMELYELGNERTFLKIYEKSSIKSEKNGDDVNE